VVISCGADTIARHVRSYEREDFVFDPLHYLALLERKIGALDQAAPLAGWDLPEACRCCGCCPGYRPKDARRRGHSVLHAPCPLRALICARRAPR
jgi:hypothetical protein